MEFDVISYLESRSRNKRDFVTSRLERGSLFENTLTRILIDDPTVFRRIGSFKEGTIPVELLYSFFQSDLAKLHKLYESSLKKPLNFSDLVRERTGACLERAILTQLALQDFLKSFIVIGHVRGGGFDDFHAYNILSIGNNPFLFDSGLPLKNGSEGKFLPYLIPISQIRKGTVIFFEGSGDGRVYRT